MRSELRNILDEYADRRANEEARVNNLIKKIIDENPEFKKARAAYSSARAGQAMAKLSGEVFDINKEKKAYNDALTAACKNSGISEEDLQITYGCADCSDTGYVGENQRTLCHCVVNRITRSILSSQNLKDDATFATFDEKIFPTDKKVDRDGRNQREHILYMKDRAQNWCEAFPKTKKLQTLFIGKTGVGKSFLTSCIAHQMIEKGYSVINSTASGINEAMLKVINDRDNSVLSLFKSTDLLIIDDLGVEPMISNITVETLYDVLEYRITNSKHTIICTNLTLVQIQEKYGYRISSRILSAKNTAIMQILGDDLRRL